MTAPDAVVRRLYDRFMGHGDRAVAEELLHDDFVDHSNPAAGAGGKAELIELVLSARAKDPDLTSTVVESRSGGDLTMVRVESSIAGKSWRELHVFRIAGDQIVERWGLRTPAEAAQI